MAYIAIGITVLIAGVAVLCIIIHEHRIRRYMARGMTRRQAAVKMAMEGDSFTITF